MLETFTEMGPISKKSLVQLSVCLYKKVLVIILVSITCIFLSNSLPSGFEDDISVLYYNFLKDSLRKVQESNADEGQDNTGY